MELRPYHTAALALLALVPVGIYIVWSGRIEPLVGVLGVLNVLVISVGLMLMFGITARDSAGHGNGVAQ